VLPVQIPVTIEVLGVAMIRGGQVRRLRCSVFLCLLAPIITGAPPSQAQDDDAQRQEHVLFNGEVQVSPGKRYNLTFTTSSNFRNARIAGSVQAQGGAGNDIRVLVVKGQSLIYDSGRRRSVVMSVDCTEPGQYVLMFDNSFSLVSPKIVAGTISLVHWGVNVEQNEADRQEAIAHYTQASDIMQRLYAALKADERVWGTTQLFAVPAIRLNNESSINAAANWVTNSIQVNRGLFRLADKAGDKGEDVLAATLAHEMSHIFYRHPGYGSSGQGVKGLFDELRGVTALDRVQETEADVLGIKVACQAGFDPQGMLILMRLFEQLDSSASSFMKNHPAAVERYNYLQGEATKCQSPQSRQGPAPQEAPVAEPAADSSGGEGMWKLTQNPNSRWKFKVGDQFLYGEHAYPEERRKLGDFDTVDVKKQGDGFAGMQRMRVTFRIKDASPQGFRYKACQWVFAVELTSVTDDRIEGRWEGYPPDSQVNPLTCERSGERIWEDVAWVRELSVVGQTARTQSPRGTSSPSFTAPITTVATAQAFESFVDKNRGNLVHLNIQMGLRFSRIESKIQGKDDLFVATEPCDPSQPVVDCAGSHYLLSGKDDYVLEFYQGDNRLTGYFLINENREMHQGVYYSLKSVPAAQVLLPK
jgi:hypothetical protein